MGWLRESFAGAWQRGVSPEPIGALAAFSAVFAAIALIAADIGKLRLKLMVQDDRSGIWQEVRSGLPVHTLLQRPNTYSTRAQFITHWLVSKLLYGNAYIFKWRGYGGRLDQLHVLDPRRVTPMVTPEGDVYYSLGGDDLSRVPAGQVLPASEVMHDRHITLWHPLVGVSPIYACGMSATQGLRIQGNSARFFENMSRPSGMLSAPGTIDEVTAARLKTEWESNYSGLNLGRLAILGDGLKYEPMTIPASDAQLIEQLRWTVEDVARAFRVPLHMLQAGVAPSLNNVEALTQFYHGQTLQTLIESIEQVLDIGLGLPQGMRTEFDLRDLLRMDTASRFDALGKAVGGGWLSPNEARAMEDLPPVKGGESPMAQQQNFSLSALAKRDALPDPFNTTPAGSSNDRVETSRAITRALDDLIDHMPEQQRAAFLCARDAKWVRKMFGGEFVDTTQPAGDDRGAMVVKEFGEAPNFAPMIEAQTEVARAQLRAADAMTDAAREQADAAREVTHTAETTAYLATEAAKAKDKPRGAWETTIERDPVTGAITGMTMVSVPAV